MSTVLSSSLPLRSLLPGSGPQSDGGNGHSEHILFGSNVNLSDPGEKTQPKEASADGTVRQSVPKGDRIKSENDAIAAEGETDSSRTKTTEEEDTSAKEREIPPKTDGEEREKDVKMGEEGEEKAEHGGEEGQEETWKSAPKEKDAYSDAEAEENKTLHLDDPTAKL